MHQEGQTAVSYDFAFPLVAKAGNGRRMVVPISSAFGEQNWLELVNTLQQNITVDVDFYSEDGSLADTQQLELSAYEQRHFNASTKLSAGEAGHVVITPNTPNSVIAQSMFYFRDDAGSISAMYGSQARQASSRMVFGSYNRFLAMNNWLRISNASANEVELNTFGQWS